ncbi:hypothetical protein P0M11_08290 [Kaistella sp. PBT33-4]|uniref:hypothetical protein n=1 Tax=Kaistella sp. PBT33-4 TaxID=3032000 RepID=UPI0023D850D2|nr:hypothetical protein [Kaistella sp. PBT33-4]MDF0719998.1 hypothetical protein [Kaistella sp. PBT33-4]
MENILIQPFTNLASAVKSIDDEVQLFYSSFAVEAFAPRVSINNETRVVSMLKDFHTEGEDEMQYFYFDDYFGMKILALIQEGIKNLQTAIEFQKKLNNDLAKYLEIVKSDVREIFTETIVSKFNFLEKYKIILNDNIELCFSAYQRKKRIRQPIEFIDAVAKSGSAKIELLYTGLFEADFINCSKQQFLNILADPESGSGIPWLAKSSKNNTTNKALLIYLFRRLIDEKHIRSTFLNDENYYLTSIFRNRDGSHFTSQQLSTSKYSLIDKKKKSSQEEVIDTIIDTL